MALLTRMVGVPLIIDIGAGAVAGLAPLLADRRISSGGHVAAQSSVQVLVPSVSWVKM